jgi:hypothetical protein
VRLFSAPEAAAFHTDRIVWHAISFECSAPTEQCRSATSEPLRKRRHSDRSLQSRAMFARRDASLARVPGRAGRYDR